MIIAIAIIVQLVHAACCMAIAGDKGRNANKWAAIGLLTGLFGVVFAVCLERRPVTA